MLSYFLYIYIGDDFMKELRLGRVTTKELADWFGISYGSFRVCKNQKLEDLKMYCKYHEVYGGIIIDEIYDDNNIIYIRDSQKNYDIVKSSFDEEWSPTGLDTCSNVAIKIYDKHQNELTITDTTAYNYVIKARDELYGKPFTSLGTLGSCIYIWCRKEVVNDTIVYTQFTDEEDKIKKDLMRKYFSTDVEKEIMVAEMVNRKEITKEQAYDVLCELKHLNGNGFMAFKKELEETLGCDVARGTLLDRNANKIEFLENK